MSNQENAPTPERRNTPNRDDLDLFNVDHVVTSAKPSQFEAQLHIFEDMEAVIKTIIKGRRPTMRHVSRTHRVALDWLFERLNLDPEIHIKNVDTKKKSGNAISVCSTSWTFHSLHLAISARPAPPRPCRKDQYSKGDREKMNEWLRNQNQCRIWCRRLNRSPTVLVSSASRSPVDTQSTKFKF